MSLLEEVDPRAVLPAGQKFTMEEINLTPVDIARAQIKEEYMRRFCKDMGRQASNLFFTQTRNPK